MMHRQTLRNGVLGGLGVIVLAATTLTARGSAQAPETFSATATVKTAAGATATAPVTIVVTRVTPQSEADRLRGTFKSGGPSALRKALVGLPPTGSVQLGGAASKPTRLTLDRPTDKGRLLTIVTDEPLLFLAAGVPGAKPKEGYDFAIIDIEVDGKGNGSGTIAPAAKVTLKQDIFIVDDYAAELVRLTAVKKVK
jgi:hypothetical protein